MSKEHDPKPCFTPSHSSASEDFEAKRRQDSGGSDFFFTGGFKLPGAPTIPAHTPSPRFSELSPGTLLRDRYEIEDCLGQGGTGVVYRAFDRLRERPLCLKVLHDPLSDATKYELQQEILIQEQLHHDGIARTYDLDVDKATRRIFFSMELIEGPSLAEVFSLAEKERVRPVLSLTEIRLILQELTEVLSYVHSKGFVHCDLKPSNLLLPVNGGIKILDFGLAVSSREQHVVPVPKGTAVYMAPEQLRLNARPTPATDVYSTAVLLYQMLTGELFYGRMPGAFEWLVEHGIEPAFSPEVDEVLFQALHALPEHRFQGIREFQEAFEFALVEPTLVEDVQSVGELHLGAFPLAWLPVMESDILEAVELEGFEVEDLDWIEDDKEMEDDEELGVDEDDEGFQVFCEEEDEKELEDKETGLACADHRLQYARAQRREWESLEHGLKFHRQSSVLPVWGMRPETFSLRPRLIHHFATPGMSKTTERTPSLSGEVPRLSHSMLLSILSFCLGCLPVALLGIWANLMAQKALQRGDLETARQRHHISFALGFVGTALMLTLYSLPLWFALEAMLRRSHLSGF